MQPRSKTIAVGNGDDHNRSIIVLWGSSGQNQLEGGVSQGDDQRPSWEGLRLVGHTPEA